MTTIYMLADLVLVRMTSYPQPTFLICNLLTIPTRFWKDSMTVSLQDLAQSSLAKKLCAQLAPLLLPISANSPAGPSLRYDPLYDRVRSARNVESDALPQGVWQRELPQADWATVDHLTTDALRGRSKDLQLAVWRTEALLHLHGLPGFISGLQLILGLHCTFLSTMHPAPESEVSALPLEDGDSGVECRLNLVQWLNEKLSPQLKLLFITSPDELTGLPAFTFADMEAARLQDQHKDRGNLGENRLKLFEQSLSVTPSKWLNEWCAQLQQTSEIVFLLDDVLDTVYGQANVGLLKIEKVLDEMHTVVLAVLAKESRMPLPKCAEAEPTGTTPSLVIPVEVAPASTDAGPEATAFNVDWKLNLRSRNEAYCYLAEITDFLTDLEPHSPVPYLLRRAVAWCDKSLEEMLPEFLSDQATLQDVVRLLNLKQQ